MVDHEEQLAENKETIKYDKKAHKWNGHLKKTLSNDEIISQSLMFLVAGYDTTAATLEFVTYNLVMNPQVQNKLINEVDQTIEKHVRQQIKKI